MHPLPEGWPRDARRERRLRPKAREATASWRAFPSRRRNCPQDRSRTQVRRETPTRRASASAMCEKKSPPGGLPRGGRGSSGDLLSRTRGPGTIGHEGLDFRVRNGNGYDPLSITAETFKGLHEIQEGAQRVAS